MTPVEEFGRIERCFFERIAQLDPSRAAEMGLEASVTRVPSGAPEVVEERLAAYRDSHRELAALDAAALDDERRLDVELLANEASLRELDLGHGRYHLAGGDPALELGESLHGLFSREIFAPDLRIEGILTRLAGATHFLHEARGRYRRPVRRWTREAIASVGHTQAFLEEIRDGIPAILGHRIGDLDADPRGRQAARLVASATADLEEFRHWLEHEILPNPDHEMALGAEAFTELVRRRRLGHDVDQLRQLGRESFRQLDEAYRRELDGMFPGRAVPEAEAAWLDTVPESFPEVLALFREAVAQSRDFVFDRLGMPSPGPERLEIRATPEFLQSTIPSAAYFEPPRICSGDRVGVYMVTPPSVGGKVLEHAPGMIFNVSTHEGYPGHHLQLCWASRTPSLIRAWLSGDEFCEGWAHYCEELMTEEGFRPVPGMRASQLLDARFRALRILVDVGLQTGELDFDTAVERLVSEGGIPRSRAVGEVGWYSFRPGYPLGYLTGKILLQGLRDRVAALQGPAFSAADFHARVLAGGTMPIWAHARRFGVRLD